VGDHDPACAWVHTARTRPAVGRGRRRRVDDGGLATYNSTVFGPFRGPDTRRGLA